MKTRILLLFTLLLASIAFTTTIGYAANDSVIPNNKPQIAGSETYTTIAEPLTIRVSVSSDEIEGNMHTQKPAISDDGRFVTFVSSSDNLVVGDTNGVNDIFVHDTLTGATKRVSVSSSGDEANAASVSSNISADGRYIVYVSYASNLVSDDDNNMADVFVYDQVTQETERVSTGPAIRHSTGDVWTELDGAYAGITPDISADGRYVAYTRESMSPHFFVFFHDRDAHDTYKTDAVAYRSLSISADGRYIAFDSRGDLIPEDHNYEDDVYIYDIETLNLTLASVSTSGVIGDKNSSGGVSISADGRYVAFASYASNLGSGENRVTYDNDIFVHDQQTGTTICVSNKGQSNGSSSDPRISADGQFVTFSSNASNLVDNDLNGNWDVFVYDLLNQQSDLVSISSSAAQGNNHSGPSAISIDGRYIAFQSSADNLVEDDTNGVLDIFVHDRGTALNESIISGQVKDADGSPIAGATVMHSGGQAVISDINGYYSFTALAAGTYTLTASHANYISFTSLTINVPPSNFDANLVGTPIPINHAPEITAELPTVTNYEGNPLVNTGAANDIDGDVLTLTATLGTVTYSAELQTWEWYYVPDDGPAESQDVWITASDDAGVTDQISFSIIVENQAPEGSFIYPTTVNEGEIIELSLVDLTDPSMADTATGFEFHFDCGYGSEEPEFSPETACETADDATLLVQGRVTDKDAGSSLYTGTVVVANVAPSIVMDVEQEIEIIAGESISLTGHFEDPGLDSWDIVADFGDGTLSENYGAADKTIDLVHTYSTEGEYMIFLTVTDDDGGQDTETWTVKVKSPAEAIQDLIDVVEALNLQNGIENSLDAKLESAQAALSDINANNDQAAINSIYAFINAVEAQKDNKISSEDADMLIKIAVNILTILESAN